ncbi:MAG: aconitase family protein, partial [Pseudomonadota bacterium]
FCGSAIEAMSLEARLTLCNMAVEFSAFTAVIAPDDKVFEAIEGTPFAPTANDWTHSLNDWRALKSDADAVFDAEVILNGADIRPSVSWGTSPEQAVPCDGLVPNLADIPELRRDLAERAMAYMDIKPGQPLNALQIDGAFIGSCTNGRLTDLRAAAVQLKDRRIASGVKAVCVPGSNAVKRAAECEGLDKIFIAAGFDWGEPGCAMCFYAGGDTFAPGDRVISSTNRNFEGRQGPGVRTHLASPATVAASAVAGRIVPAVSRTDVPEAI